MPGEAGLDAATGGVPIRRIPVPEVRDYHQINRRVAQWLDAGVRRIRLEGVERQRLLLNGLRGAWSAIVEVVGHAGPELAAGCDAPGLVVVAHGAVDDGAGRDLAAGVLAVRGPCGVAVGYRQRGGLIVACADAGPRAGLEQAGGRLVVLGRATGRPGERRRGGRLDILGGGRPVEDPASPAGGPGSTLDEALQDLAATLADVAPWFRERVAPLTRT
jgi:glutamate synthase domain-containing protein 3